MINLVSLGEELARIEKQVETEWWKDLSEVEQDKLAEWVMDNITYHNGEPSNLADIDLAINLTFGCGRKNARNFVDFVVNEWIFTGHDADDFCNSDTCFYVDCSGCGCGSPECELA